MKEPADELFGSFLRDHALAVLRRSILDPAELLHFRAWLFRLADFFNICAVFAMCGFAWAELLLFPLPAALVVPALHALLFTWMRRRRVTERNVRAEFLHVVVSCTLAVIVYVALTDEPLGTLVALCNLTFVSFSIIGIAPWAGLLVMAITLGGLYWLRLLQSALELPVQLLSFPDDIISATGVGWLFLVVFFTTTFIANLVWLQKERLITARRSLEDANNRLRAAEHARGEFLSAVTHELRTPLVAISGYTDLMLRKQPGEANLAVIKRSAKRLQRLIEELLDMAAPMNLASRMRLEPVDLREVLHEEAEAQREAAQACRVRFELDDADSCTVRADRTRIAQVVANLLDNALKHSPPGSTIRLGTRSEAALGQGLLWIADEGPGIENSVLTRIFEPFYTHLSGDLVPSLGLGLPICRQIVSVLQGDIEVQSTPGAGTRFTVRLPLDDAEPGRAEAPPPAPLQALVLDDETDVLSLMRESLGAFGFSVDFTRNGNTALEKAMANQYDLILLDVNVPGLTGIEVSRKLRAAGRPGKVLLFSALIRHDADAIIAESMADGFMPKPFTLETLERPLRQFGFVIT